MLVKSLYRARFQQALREAFDNGEIRLPPDHKPSDFRRIQRSTYDKQWSVRIEPQYAHGRGVLLYLSRYLRGGPINPKQIVQCDHKHIGFRYKDHRTKHTKVITLTPDEFIRRILLHVPETGQHMVRHYGLYSSAGRDKRNLCRQQIGGLIESLEESQDKTVMKCRSCGASLRHIITFPGSRKKANSYRVESHTRFAQQIDEPDLAEAKKTSSRMRV